MSRSVIGTSPVPPCVNRSPQKKVRVCVSNIMPQSQPCGRCGVSCQRRAYSPSVRISPSASGRAGQSAMSFTDTMAPTWLQTGTAFGAAARKSLSDPHSSAS